MKSFFTFLCFFCYFFIGLPSSFAFEIKMSDAIAPFFDAEKEIEHYSHIPFYQIDSYEGDELVDQKQITESLERYKLYIKKLKENGYTALSLDDINHLLLFERSGYYQGTKLYERNKLYRALYKELIALARSEGLDVYLTTDFQFYTTELQQATGLDFDVYDTKIDSINTEAIKEILASFPDIAGIIFRVGEGGSSYNAGAYKSAILYTKAEDIRRQLSILLPIFEAYDKQLVFRTWTIGIGDIGDLVHSKQTYDEVFQGFDSDNLLVSIKHTPGDFFWFEQENPTIGHGNLKQIVEIQVRREYEGGGDIPNYMGDYYQKLYSELQTKNNVIGVHNWNQTGGWGYGKNIIFNFGFTFWNELNFYTVGNVLKTGSPKLKSILERYDFSEEQRAKLYEILKNSRSHIKDAWYIDAYRKESYKFSDIYIPPLNRIWWDKVTSSPVVLSIIYNSISDKNASLVASSAARDAAKDEWQAWVDVGIETELQKNIANSLENRYKIFDILHSFKHAFFHFYETGERMNQEVLSKKIQAYNNFLLDKPYFHFDFSEISHFYKQNKYHHQALFLHLLFVILYLLYAYSLKIQNSKIKKSTLYDMLSIIVLLILLFGVFVSPFYFLSWHNLYFIVSFVSVYILLVSTMYFVCIGYILKTFFKIDIIVSTKVKNTIFLSFIFFLILEGIVLLSLVFGENIFWKFLTYGYFQQNLGLLYSVVFVFYMLFFIALAVKVTNIRTYIKQLSHEKKSQFFLYISTPILLFVVLGFPIPQKIIEYQFKKILPSYFFEAGSSVDHFF